LNSKMKIVLVFVSTLDGKVTKWDDPHVRKWSSKSDQVYFSKLWKDSRLTVMGINTYNAEPPSLSAKRRLIIMTHRPSDYKRYEVPGQIEFTDGSPALLTSRYEKEGYEQMMVVGGPQIATSFLKEQLADELWLTIEPKIFGMGSNLVTQDKLDINLSLISIEKVNDYGTLITKYAILKN
jgi:dihydrofolate reductase